LVVEDDLAERWIARAKSRSDQYFDAWIAVDRYVHEQPALGWRIILKIVELAEGDESVLGSVGAGPLEDLVRLHPVPYLDLAEAEAAANPPFAQALRITRYPGHEL
jgi:hypothetical protein